ncbi:MAG TPA: YihY family inner membrane protein [Casimicrobiaceae bacterium]|nr:YihY family inner membrane protein [Casimicrobiaceae bacterium]
MFTRLRAFAMFVLRVLRRLQATQFLRIAASLSFTTLLGLVPLFTVAFAYVAPYSMFEHWQEALEPVLLRFLLPGTGGAAGKYLAEFTAKTASLKGIGTALVVLTAVLLVAEVEREINAIWGVHEARTLPRRIIVYVLGFVAVPALIGAAVYATSWLIDTSVAAVPLASAALPYVTRPFSLALGTVLLTLTYKLVPARSVPLRAAFIGGFLAALAFEGAKFGFAFYITHVRTYEIVYGALAALPLFLIWIYVCWIILLVGAAVAATLAEHRWGRSRKRRRA